MADFVPRRVPNQDARLRAIEDYLIAAGARVPEEVAAAPQQSVPSAAGTSSGGGSGGSSGTSSFGYMASVPERKVVFDATGGHAHDGTDAHTVTIVGDVSGTNVASAVDKLKGKALPAAPGSGQDKQALRWNDGGAAYEFARFSTLCPLGAWSHADLSTLTNVDAEITNAWAAATVIANPMPTAGVIVGLAVKLTGDVGAATQNLIVTVYKNGVTTTTVTVTITGAAGTENEAVTTVTPVTFVAGDDITVYARHSGVAPAAVRAVCTVWGAFN